MQQSQERHERLVETQPVTIKKGTVPPRSNYSQLESLVKNPEFSKFKPQIQLLQVWNTNPMQTTDYQFILLLIQWTTCWRRGVDIRMSKPQELSESSKYKDRIDKLEQLTENWCLKALDFYCKTMKKIENLLNQESGVENSFRNNQKTMKMVMEQLLKNHRHERDILHRGMFSQTQAFPPTDFETMSSSPTTFYRPSSTLGSPMKLILSNFDDVPRPLRFVKSHDTFTSYIKGNMTWQLEIFEIWRSIYVFQNSLNLRIKSLLEIQQKQQDEKTPFSSEALFDQESPFNLIHIFDEYIESVVMCDSNSKIISGRKNGEYFGNAFSYEWIVTTKDLLKECALDRVNIESTMRDLENLFNGSYFDCNHILSTNPFYQILFWCYILSSIEKESEKTIKIMCKSFTDNFLTLEAIDLIERMLYENKPFVECLLKKIRPFLSVLPSDYRKSFEHIYESFESHPIERK